MATRIGVDVGGTFTDLIYFDEETGQVSVGKGPSNPTAVEDGVRNIVTATVDESGIAAAAYFLHGTTVGLNALLERKGARVGILTTEGFRDILEQRRQLRIDERGERPFDLLFKTPDPLVPRALRLGVTERIMADGTVETPLDEYSARQAGRKLMQDGVECIAVVFINAHANPAHELRAVEILREEGFEGAVSLSHEVTGQYREYERTSTTTIDAYVRPAVSGYLDRLESGLSDLKFGGHCLITTSSGGCVSFDEATSRPFETVMSGPVAGVVGSTTVCRELGLDLAITADVGGTSFDTCLLVDGRPTIRYEGTVVGMPLQTLWVDVRSVGAGGGSIAHIDDGLLSVGPRSAGAVPGPVCYGRGGTEPTVTDATVTLGMLARTTLASGLVLNVDAARESLAALGAPLGLDAEEVARGVVQIAAASMANAIRAVTIEVGEDPRRGALLAYGGAGPLFGSLLAQELGIGQVVIPNHAGNFSAWGLLEQDLVRSAALTITAPLSASGLERAGRVLRDLFAQLEARASGRRLTDAVTHEAEFDLRYEGQEYSLALSVPIEDDVFVEAVDSILVRFASAYERTYGHSFDVDVTIVSVRAIERESLPRPSVAFTTDVGEPEATESARAYSFSAGDWLDFQVIERAVLTPGSSFDGPAIVVEPTTTSYVDHGFTAAVHDTGVLILTSNAR